MAAADQLGFLQNCRISETAIEIESPICFHVQNFEYGINLAGCFMCSIGLSITNPIWPPGTRKCNRYPSSSDT